jgi:hypothetical protein
LEKIFFSSKKLREGKVNCSEVIAGMILRSRSKTFLAKRVKGAVNNLYMKVLHIGRLFE